MTPSAPPLVEPAFHSVPDYAYTLGPEVCELVGDCYDDKGPFVMDPEQSLALDYTFAADRSGRNAAFEMGVIAPRQNLKTGVLKAIALGKLYILEQRLVVWSAHEFFASREAFRDLKILIESNPDLDREVVRVLTGSGSESIELTGDRRILFKARSSGAGRSLSGDTVILDEAFALSPEEVGALLPTMAARPNPQAVYGSSAGMVRSAVLRSLRNRGRRGTDRVAYAEWCADRRDCEDLRCNHAVGTPGCALDDRGLWLQANTAVARGRMTVETIAGLRESLPPDQFMRECLGWWDEDGTAAAFGVGKWEACVGLERPADLDPTGLALAVSIDLSHVAVAAAAVDDGGVLWLRPLEHWSGATFDLALVRQVQDEFNLSLTVDKRGPAASLIPQLEQSGVRLRLVDTQTVCDAYDTIFQKVRDGKARHPDNVFLNAAVSGAVARPVGDRFTWGRKSSTSDISLLEAVTLAGGAAVVPVSAPKEPLFAWG